MDEDSYRLIVLDDEGEVLDERGYARDAKVEALIRFIAAYREYPARRVELYAMPRGYLLRVAGPPVPERVA